MSSNPPHDRPSGVAGGIATVGAFNVEEHTDPLLQFFAYEHLRLDLQAISQPFGDLARQIVGLLPRNPERTVALRKLLEAKDCAVRASLWGNPP
jgi:hypothetical protein